jgi:hypothetical protein
VSENKSINWRACSAGGSVSSRNGGGAFFVSDVAGGLFVCGAELDRRGGAAAPTANSSKSLTKTGTEVGEIS